MSSLSPQFIPVDASAEEDNTSHGAFHGTAPHRARRDDYPGAMDTEIDTGKERQHWTGTGRLAPSMKGAISTRERSLSLVSSSGDAYGIPDPIQEGSIGTYSFTMG